MQQISSLIWIRYFFASPSNSQSPNKQLAKKHKLTKWPKPFLCSLYYVVTDRYKLLGTDFYELSYLVLTSSNEANMLHCTKWNCVGFSLTWYESSGDNFYRETLTLQACQLRRSHTAVLSVEQLNLLNCFTWIIDSQNIPDQYVPEIYLFLRNEYIMTFTLPLSNAKWRGPLDVPGGTSLGLLL